MEHEISGDEAEFDEPSGSKNEGEENGRYSARTMAYIKELLHEKHNLNVSNYPHSSRLVDEEVKKTQESGRVSRDNRYVDIFKEKPIKVVIKVMIPVKDNPKFNFVGKLLGPKGNSLKRLQEETLCRMSILGRNSMRDKAKEEELRNSLDPKYAHLSDDLHVQVSTVAPPAEAHGRISFALGQLRKYLVPDGNDEISQGQLRELGYDGVVENGRGRPNGPQTNYKGGPGRSSFSNNDSKARVLSILEKARNAMDGGGTAYYNNAQSRDTYEQPRNYQGYNDGAYNEPQRYEENSRGTWKTGYKSTYSSRGNSRNNPYSRPRI